MSHLVPSRQDDRRPASPFDAIRQYDGKGEHWSAREMSPYLGYTKWQNFMKALKRAILACGNDGHDSSEHFTEASKPIPGGKGSIQRVVDYRPSRRACYLTALNSDPAKPEVAAAQAYFVEMTRKAEIAPPVLDMNHPDPLVRFVLADYERRQQIAEITFVQDVHSAALAKLGSRADDVERHGRELAAILVKTGANVVVGRRTNAEKRSMVILALKSETLKNCSDRAIAAWAGVAPSTVGKYRDRKELPAKRTVIRNGTTYLQVVPPGRRKPKGPQSD